MRTAVSVFMVLALHAWVASAAAQVTAPRSPTSTRPVTLPATPARTSAPAAPTPPQVQPAPPSPVASPPAGPIKPTGPAQGPAPTRPAPAVRVYDAQGRAIPGARPAGPNRVMDVRTGRYYQTVPSGDGQRVVK